VPDHGTQGLPEGYVTRAPTMEDFPAVAGLVLASDVADFGEPDYPEEELLADWRGSDLAADARVVFAPDGEAAGYVSISHREHVRLDAEGFVHPRYLGRGIGTLLVRFAEARAREHVPLAPPGSRVVLNNNINGRNAAARRVLESEGYEAVRHFWRMAVDLDGAPPEPGWPEGVAVRACVPGRDERTFFEVSDEAFRDHWGYVPGAFEEWEKRKKHLGFDPGLWFLAESGGETVGVAVCEDRAGMGWVDELAVRGPWRRRGLGLALLRHALGEFYRRGKLRVALGVDSESLTGATRLYERAGMLADRLYTVYRKELRPGNKRLASSG
jgi:mycothiol synthase